MNATERKRLEGAGWKVADTKEFLGLTDEESEIIEIKLRLADALKAQRVRRGWSQHQLAAFLGTSQSRVAKTESADASVSLDLMFRSLLKIGSSRADLGAYLSGRKARRRAA